MAGVLISSTLLLVKFALVIHGDLQDVTPCLPGPFQKYHPSPEIRSLPECQAFNDNSCCQYHIADEIAKHGAINLYGGYHWDRCGRLSEQCKAFLVHEECFYQCEPSLQHFQDPAHPGKGYIKNVPICASYCDSWFEACRSDKTCVVDWLKDFNFTSSGNHCPSGSECKTFEAVYGNGEGLCNNMWGDVFYYEEDETSCMLMNFYESCKNPNACGRRDVTCNKGHYSGCGRVAQRSAAEPPRS